MKAEHESLLENNTLKLVSHPKSTKSKTHKAWLAIKGYKQKYGLDYLETFSSVVRVESIDSAAGSLTYRHVDFVTAFLNDVLADVEIVLEQREGYDDGSGRMSRLMRCLYDLKQASQLWNNTFHNHLITIGFKKCIFDADVYWKVETHNKNFLTVHVDDIVIAADAKDIAGVVAALGADFKLKGLSRVKYLLGMEINYKPAYIDRMFEKFELAAAKSVRSPQM
ncbi:LOW QUALITY PROTEIN: Gag-pol Polyprotein [Phytophthora megakarya]|uniref:Gag-pol Polyprotein n=1 Tax=Phytophthora megakarya TaxID=4795 RepID=A0A225WJZ8_9STRA|nr:LOW QUALITY PROTEIN: Gag-pol Polyprotein [Phytophthora megakarya]